MPNMGTEIKRMKIYSFYNYTDDHLENAQTCNDSHPNKDVEE